MIGFCVEREIGCIGNPDALEKAVSFDSGPDFVAERRAKLGEGSPPPVWVFRCVYCQRCPEDGIDRFRNSPYASTLAHTRSLDVGANRKASTAHPLRIDPDCSIGERSARIELERQRGGRREAQSKCVGLVELRHKSEEHTSELQSLLRISYA